MQSRERGREDTGRNNGQNFPSFVKYTNLHIQEVQQTSRV